jgi:hypothetical protein
MVDVDKIPVEKIKSVLDWATSDSFWKVNIRSASTFREKFGALEAKSRSVDPRQAYVEKERRVGASTGTMKSDPEMLKTVIERLKKES